MPGDENLVLGVDMGTTSVKVCLVAAGSCNGGAGTGGASGADGVTVLARHTKDTAADVRTSAVAYHEQNVPKILSTLHNCISRLPRDLLRQVRHIGISGQMHGVVLWQDEINGRRLTIDDIVQQGISEGSGSGGGGGSGGGASPSGSSPTPLSSTLYTWQDARCTPDFLNSLPQPRPGSVVHSGYGCATLFWLAKNRPEELEKYTCAGTIHDLVTSLLCGLAQPAMSVQNAESWGYCDVEEAKWQLDVLESDADFPVRLLPRIVRSEETVGALTEAWEGIPAGTTVGAALGDFQCSVLATKAEEHDAVLNISTSAQIAFVLPSGFKPEEAVQEEGNRSKAVLYFPYFEGRYLAVATSINGGNALATFIRTLQQWTLDLGFHVPQSTLWEKVVNLGLQSPDDASLLPVVSPTLLGERHNPVLRGTVTNLDPGNLGLGAIFRALCRGIVNNLLEMLPREVLLKHSVRRVVGGGSALMRNTLLQAEVRAAYQMDVTFTSTGDAAVGAAMAAKLQSDLSANQN